MSACAPGRAAPGDGSGAHPSNSPATGPSEGPLSPRGSTDHRGAAPDRPAHVAAPGGDISASITVFFLAIPLSLGLAIAVGAPLQSGLVGAAVGGIVAGLLSGTPLLVSGPSAGLAVVTAQLIQTYGWRTTCAISVLAGLVQLGLGALRVARSALAVSPAVVHGTLAGIGVSLALAQLHVVLGGDPEGDVLANLVELPAQFAGLSPAGPAVAGLTIAVLLLWPRLPGRAGRLAGRVPAALVAVVVATAAATAFAPELARVTLPAWDDHVLPELPEGPVLGLAAAVLTVTVVASLESLLSAVAVDKLETERPGPSGPRTDLDKELRGQGISNIVTGVLGGLPISGGAVRGSANVRAGARTRWATVLHGVWVLLATLLFVGALELIPLAALAALVMVVGIRMVDHAHIRNVHKNREFWVYAGTISGVLLVGVLQGVLIGVGLAVVTALHRLAHTGITQHTDAGGIHHTRVRGQLTFLAVPRLSRALAHVPEGSTAVVEWDGSFMDHAAHETLRDWQTAHTATGGEASVTGPSGQPVTGPGLARACRPWTPWRNHQCPDAASGPGPATSRGRLLGGVRDFQRDTAPLVREELARLAKEGQRPSQLFLTCSDSRLVTSMITSSGPGDLFTVRNVGNLVPLPGEESGDDSVAAAIEYAVDVLRVESVTVCGHSGCGAMRALHSAAEAASAASPGSTPRATPLSRWLRHGQPSLERLAGTPAGSAPPRLADREPADEVESLCLSNVVQQLEHLAAHPCVARRLAEGSLELHGMYFDVAHAQTYVLDGTDLVAPAGRPGPGRTGDGRGERDGTASGSRAGRVPAATRHTDGPGDAVAAAGGGADGDGARAAGGTLTTVTEERSGAARTYVFRPVRGEADGRD